MKKIVKLIAVIIILGCGPVSPQVVETGVVVVQSLIEFVQSLLDRVERTRAVCDRYTREDTGKRNRATFECAEINDAAINVSSALEQYNENPTSENEGSLSVAARELEAVLELSSMAAK